MSTKAVFYSVGENNIGAPKMWTFSVALPFFCFIKNVSSSISPKKTPELIYTQRNVFRYAVH